MKLSTKIAMISSLGALALIGTGFAAWTFTNQVSADVTTEAKVTAAIEAKNVKVKVGSTEISKLYLICDAPETAASGRLAGNGIYWSTENSNDVSKKVTALTLVGSVNEDDNDIVDFSTYTGKFTSVATNAVNGTYVDIAATSALDVSVTSTSKNADVETTFTLPAPSYDTIPATVAEVNSLEAEVHAISLTFSFKFEVTAINA